MRHGASDETQGVDRVPVGQAVELVCDSVLREDDSSRFPCEVHGAKCPKFALKWIGPDNIWVFDRIAALHVKDQQDGTLNKGKQLAAALVGLNPYTVPSYWIDDETGEFGFDAQKQQVAGQLMRGMKVQAELLRKVVEGEARIRVARYVGAQLPAATPAAAPPSPPPDRQPTTPLL